MLSEDEIRLISLMRRYGPGTEFRILKQITNSAIYPNGELKRAFVNESIDISRESSYPFLSPDGIIDTMKP